LFSNVLYSCACTNSLSCLSCFPIHHLPNCPYFIGMRSPDGYWGPLCRPPPSSTFPYQVATGGELLVQSRTILSRVRPVPFRPVPCPNLLLSCLPTNPLHWLLHSQCILWCPFITFSLYCTVLTAIRLYFDYVILYFILYYIVYRTLSLLTTLCLYCVCTMVTIGPCLYFVLYSRCPLSPYH